jgi:hypothetical protein
MERGWTFSRLLGLFFPCLAWLAWLAPFPAYCLGLAWYACNTSVLDTILSGLAWLGLACLSDTPPRYRTKGGSGCPFAIFLFFIIFFYFSSPGKKKNWSMGMSVWEFLFAKEKLPPFSARIQKKGIRY